MTSLAGLRPEYDETHHRIRACVAGEVVGEALLAHLGDGAAAGSVEVNPDWRRRGVGAQLLQRLRRAATVAGYDELVVLAPLDGEGAVAFLAACGIRARIRFTYDGLLIRMTLPGAGEGVVQLPDRADAGKRDRHGHAARSRPVA